MIHDSGNRWGRMATDRCQLTTGNQVGGRPALFQPEPVPSAVNQRELPTDNRSRLLCRNPDFVLPFTASLHLLR